MMIYGNFNGELLIPEVVQGEIQNHLEPEKNWMKPKKPMVSYGFSMVSYGFSAFLSGDQTHQPHTAKSLARCCGSVLSFRRCKRKDTASSMASIAIKIFTNQNVRSIFKKWSIVTIRWWSREAMGIHIFHHFPSFSLYSNTWGALRSCQQFFISTMRQVNQG